MRKLAQVLAAASLVLAASFRTAGAANDLLDQTVEVGGVTATVTVQPYPSIRNDFLIAAAFKSSTYPLVCLSDYDFRYELQASDGRIVPINQEALKGPGQELGFFSNPNGRDFDCKTYTSARTWMIDNVLSKLFPGLPPGGYALHITFAPHGTGKSVELRPAFITIAPAPTAS